MTLKTKAVKKIFSVKIRRMVDESPDTSWLGEYSNRKTSPFSIDRKHSLECKSIVTTRDDYTYTHDVDEGECSRCSLTEAERKAEPCPDYDFADDCDCSEVGDMERGQYRYFNPSFNYVDAHGNPLPEETPETVRKYTLQDYERMERLNRGDWCFLGIQAVAEVGVSLDGGKTFQLDTLTSGSVWGIESDSEASYLEETGRDELSNLKDVLIAFGFGRSTVAKAIKNAETEQ